MPPATVDVDLALPGKAQVLLQDQWRYIVLHGGRGSAKSHSVAQALIALAMRDRLRILCCREVQRSIRDSVHRLLSDYISKLRLEPYYEILDTEIRGRNGSLFLFSGLSTQTIDSIKSLEGVDLVWVEEAQCISERSWKLLIPTIRKPGSRFAITMNPELESDPTSQRFLINTPPNCICVEMNYSDNPWFPAELEAERLYHQKHYPDTYAHVWEGKHLPAVEGAIWFHEIQAAEASGRVRDVPYDPLLKVFCIYDLGMADCTSILLVQVVASEIRVIDFIEGNNRAISEYVQDLRDKRLNFADDYLPHDGFHRALQTGKSVADTITAMGRSVRKIPDVGVETGIKTAREVFPRVYFDKTRCKDLLSHLKYYRWDMPASGGAARRPRHDEHSHAADAFRYLCVSAHLLSNNGWSQKLDYPDFYAA